MEPIVTRSIQILTVGLATEYESYYTARHTRCCCVFFIHFASSLLALMFCTIYSIIVLYANGWRSPASICVFVSFVHSFGRSVETANRSSHTRCDDGVLWCGKCDRNETMRKDEREKRKIDECPHSIRTHRVNVFCRKNVYQTTHDCLPLELIQLMYIRRCNSDVNYIQARLREIYTQHSAVSHTDEDSRLRNSHEIRE